MGAAKSRMVTRRSRLPSYVAALVRDVGIRWVFPEAAGRLTKLTARRMRLGRSSDLEIPLEGVEISHEHAELKRVGAHWTIRDLDSTNGVFVNGRRVATAKLSVGDVLRLGEWIGVLVHFREHEPSEPYRQMARSLWVGPVIGPVLERAQRVASSDLPLVIEGETGTGKECVARAIHDWSGRHGAFIAVNCAALPEALAEAELFGHRKGAFTGADRDRLGYFRAAAGGTLLLDEISDLPPNVQSKLLRALDAGEVVPLGEAMPVPIDVRIISASQRPLRSLVDEQRFRADLYARLDGLTVVLPPLRDRLEEIPYLLSCMLSTYQPGHAHRLEPRLVEQLCLSELPFNVRELRQIVRQMLALHGDEPMLCWRHLPDRYLVDSAPRQQQLEGQPTLSEAALLPRSSNDSAPGPSVDERDFSSLLLALRTHRGNVSRAAAEIGVSRQRAYRLMQAHGPVDLDAMRTTRR